MADPAGASSRRADRRDLLPFQLLMGVTAGGIGGIVTVLGVVRDEFGFSGIGIGLVVASGFVAAFVSLPAAWLYESRGPGPTWALVGLTVLALVVAGWLRIRGTVPASGPQAPRFDALS